MRLAILNAPAGFPPILSALPPTGIVRFSARRPGGPTSRRDFGFSHALQWLRRRLEVAKHAV